MQDLLTRAEDTCGLTDWGGDRWGEPRFRDRLAILCSDLENVAALNDHGRSRVHSRLHVLLCSRLRQIEHTRTRADQGLIVAPLVGTGLPRAGTTFLHGLLANDPDNRVATAAQAAIPHFSTGEENAVTSLYESILAFQGFKAPDVTAIHPFGAAAPEECVFLQEGACGIPLGAYFNVPAFTNVAASDGAVSDGYMWQRGMMQTLQQDDAKARWLLKAPSHVINVDALMTTFPDARLFVNHRDPGKVIPSMASLYMKLQSLVSDVAVEPQDLGRRLVANWRGILDRFDHWRAGHPEVQVFDVHYGDLVANPMDMVERLYAAFDLRLSDQAISAMREHLVTDHHGKAPARRYGLADFGLCEADIEAAFGDYIERHGVAREVRT